MPISILVKVLHPGRAVSTEYGKGYLFSHPIWLNFANLSRLGCRPAADTDT